MMLTRSRSGKKVKNRVLDCDDPFIYTTFGKKNKFFDNTLCAETEVSFCGETSVSEVESCALLTKSMSEHALCKPLKSDFKIECDPNPNKNEEIIVDNKLIEFGTCDIKKELSLDSDVQSDENLPKIKSNVEINIIKAQRDPILFSFGNNKTHIPDMPLLTNQEAIQETKDTKSDDLEKVITMEINNSKFLKKKTLQEKLQVMMKSKKEIDNIKEKFHISNQAKSIKQKEEKMNKIKGKPCHGPGCKKLALPQSIYCGLECIYAHAKFSIKQLQNNRSLNQSSERVVVFERSTNKILTGPAAPTSSSLATWLERHPTFEVLLSTQTRQQQTLKKLKEMKLVEKKPMPSFIEPIIKEIIEKPDKVMNSQAIKKLEPKGPNPVRISVRNAIREILNKRANNCDDVMVSSNEVKLLAMDIEEEMFQFIQEINSKYKSKLKSLLTHLRDPHNQGLFRRVLFGELKPSELVRLTEENIASKQYSEWNPMDLLEADDPPPNFTKNVEAPLDNLSLITNDMTSQHGNHFFDINCKICTGKIPAINGMPDYSNNSKTQVLETLKSQSIQFDILSPNYVEDVKQAKNIFDSYNNDSNKFGSFTSNTINSNNKNIKAHEKDKQALLPSPKMLSIPLPIVEDDEDVESIIVWDGSLICADIPPVEVFATLVSGCLDSHFSANSFSLLQQELTNSIHMTGRLSPENIISYIDQLKKSGMTNREMSIINFEPKDNLAYPLYSKLYSYLCGKNRCGVANVTGLYVKGIYIMPLPSDVPVFPILLPFDGPGLPLDRSNTLLGIVIKYSQRVAHAHVKISTSLLDEKNILDSSKVSIIPTEPKPAIYKDVPMVLKLDTTLKTNPKDLNDTEDEPYDPADIFYDNDSPTTKLDTSKNFKKESIFVIDNKSTPVEIVTSGKELEISDEMPSSLIICNKLAMIKTNEEVKSNSSESTLMEKELNIIDKESFSESNNKETITPTSVAPNELNKHTLFSVLGISNVNMSINEASKSSFLEEENIIKKSICFTDNYSSNLIDKFSLAISSTSDPNKHKKILEELTQQIKDQKILHKNQNMNPENLNIQSKYENNLQEIKIIPIEPIENVLMNKTDINMFNDSKKDEILNFGQISNIVDQLSNDNLLKSDKTTYSNNKIHMKTTSGPIIPNKNSPFDSKLKSDININKITSGLENSNKTDNTTLPKCLTELLSGISYENIRNIVASVTKLDEIPLPNDEQIKKINKCKSLLDTEIKNKPIFELHSDEGEYKLNDMGDIDYRIASSNIYSPSKSTANLLLKTAECTVKKKILLATPSFPPLEHVTCNNLETNVEIKPLTSQKSIFLQQKAKSPLKFPENLSDSKSKNHLHDIGTSNSEIKRERFLNRSGLQRSTIRNSPYRSLLKNSKRSRNHKRSRSKDRKSSKSRERKRSRSKSRRESKARSHNRSKYIKRQQLSHSSSKEKIIILNAESIIKKNVDISDNKLDRNLEKEPGEIDDDVILCGPFEKSDKFSDRSHENYNRKRSPSLNHNRQESKRVRVSNLNKYTSERHNRKDYKNHYSKDKNNRNSEYSYNKNKSDLVNKYDRKVCNVKNEFEKKIFATVKEDSSNCNIEKEKLDECNVKIPSLLNLKIIVPNNNFEKNQINNESKEDSESTIKNNNVYFPQNSSSLMKSLEKTELRMAVEENSFIKSRNSNFENMLQTGMQFNPPIIEKTLPPKIPYISSNITNILNNELSTAPTIQNLQSYTPKHFAEHARNQIMPFTFNLIPPIRPEIKNLNENNIRNERIMFPPNQHHQFQNNLNRYQIYNLPPPNRNHLENSLHHNFNQVYKPRINFDNTFRQIIPSDNKNQKPVNTFPSFDSAINNVRQFNNAQIPNKINNPPITFNQGNQNRIHFNDHPKILNPRENFKLKNKSLLPTPNIKIDEINFNELPKMGLLPFPSSIESQHIFYPQQINITKPSNVRPLNIRPHN